MDIPKIKKKVGSFLSKEEGKITKESLLKTGAAIGALALSSALAHALHGNCVSHLNNIDMSQDGNIVANHEHHGNHYNHDSHSSGGYSIF